MTQIIEQPNNKYTRDVVKGIIVLFIKLHKLKGAVKRLYESIRRNFMEQQEGKEDYVENQSKQCKYRSRRQRVCVVFIM